MNGFISRFNQYLTQNAKFEITTNEMKTESGLVRFISDKISQDHNRDSFFVLDVEDVIAKHRNWMANMPRIRPYYSVKANNSQMLLAILAHIGVGFDCVTEAELNQVLSLDVDPLDDIIYANPIKPIKHLKFAEKMSVQVMTFDNEEELIKISQHFPSAQLVIRLRVEDTQSIQPFNDKYGCVSTQVCHLLSRARSLNLDVIGVSFHVGCRCSNANAFGEAVAAAKNVFDLAKSRYGYQFSLLNIGGGFPGATWHTDKDEQFSQIAKVVNQSLDKHFALSEFANLRIVAEPGTYYCASAFHLAAQVIGKRVDIEDNTQHIHYYLNDGVFGSFFGPLWGYPCGQKSLPIKPLVNGLMRRSVTKCTVWGQTLASLDVIAKDIEIPELMPNEWLIFNDMGDYSVSLPTKFCGFEPAQLFSYDALQAEASRLFIFNFIAHLNQIK